MKSIERYLLVWVLGSLSLGSILLTLVVYGVTLDEMNEVFDVDLQHVAHAVAGYHGSTQAAGRIALQATSAEVVSSDEAGIVTLTWSQDGERLYTSDPAAQVPLIRSAGLTRQQVGDDEWIVYTTPAPGGWAQAAQRVAARQGMAGESAAKVLAPMIALVLVVAGLLSYGLRRGLRPLEAATRSVAARSAQSLTPIAADDVPRELEPMVASINGLIDRLAVAFAAQRRFLADAAHELRTPVTALRLQLQLLEGSADAAERDEAMAELRAGIDRSQRLIEQFLEVSSAEADGSGGPMANMDLQELTRSVVARLSVKADHREIDLGASGAADIQAFGNPAQVELLLANLVENALRYTPAGGFVGVKVGLHEGRPALHVIDTGPGIAEAERERVFDRFYRGEDAAALARDAGGSGLGLAIVRAIAERHRAVVSLHTPPAGKGLEVRVVFPAIKDLASA